MTIFDDELVYAAFLKRDVERRRQELDELWSAYPNRRQGLGPFTITSVGTASPSPAPVTSINSPASSATPPSPPPSASTCIDTNSLISTTTEPLEPVQASPARCSTEGHGHNEQAQVLVAAAPTSASTIAVQGAEEDTFTTAPTKCSTDCGSQDKIALPPGTAVLRTEEEFHKEPPTFVQAHVELHQRYISNYPYADSSDAVLPCLATRVGDVERVFEKKSEQYSVVLCPPFTSAVDWMLAKPSWPPPIQNRWEGIFLLNPVLLQPLLVTIVDMGPEPSLMSVEIVGILPKPPWPVIPLRANNLMSNIDLQLCFSSCMWFNCDGVTWRHRSIPWPSFKFSVSVQMKEPWPPPPTALALVPESCVQRPGPWPSFSFHRMEVHHQFQLKSLHGVSNAGPFSMIHLLSGSHDTLGRGSLNWLFALFENAIRSRVYMKECWQSVLFVRCDSCKYNGCKCAYTTIAEKCLMSKCESVDNARYTLQFAVKYCCMQWDISWQVPCMHYLLQWVCPLLMCAVQGHTRISCNFLQLHNGSYFARVVKESVLLLPVGIQQLWMKLPGRSNVLCLFSVSRQMVFCKVPGSPHVFMCLPKMMAANFVFHHYWLIQVKFSWTSVSSNTNWPTFWEYITATYWQNPLPLVFANSATEVQLIWCCQLKIQFNTLWVSFCCSEAGESCQQQAASVLNYLQSNSMRFCQLIIQSNSSAIECRKSSHVAVLLQVMATKWVSQKIHLSVEWLFYLWHPINNYGSYIGLAVQDQYYPAHDPICCRCEEGVRVECSGQLLHCVKHDSESSTHEQAQILDNGSCPIATQEVRNWDKQLKRGLHSSLVSAWCCNEVMFIVYDTVDMILTMEQICTLVPHVRATAVLSITNEQVLFKCYHNGAVKSSLLLLILHYSTAYIDQLATARPSSVVFQQNLHAATTVMELPIAGECNSNGKAIFVKSLMCNFGSLGLKPLYKWQHQRDYRITHMASLLINNHFSEQFSMRPNISGCSTDGAELVLGGVKSGNNQVFLMLPWPPPAKLLLWCYTPCVIRPPQVELQSWAAQNGNAICQKKCSNCARPALHLFSIQEYRLHTTKSSTMVLMVLWLLQYYVRVLEDP